MLMDGLKMRPSEPVAPIKSVPVGLTMAGLCTKTRGLLIKVEMECGLNPITAIINTGSEVNIVREDIWKSCIPQPVDINNTGTLLTAPPSPNSRQVPLLANHTDTNSATLMLNETSPPCSVCLKLHNGECPPLIPVPASPDVSTPGSPFEASSALDDFMYSLLQPHGPSSLPELISISDSSSESDDSLSSDDEDRAWENFRQEIIDELAQEAQDREWKAGVEARRVLWEKIEEAQNLEADIDDQDGWTRKHRPMTGQLVCYPAVSKELGLTNAKRQKALAIRRLDQTAHHHPRTKA